jgi:hypothetical protein
MWSVVGWQRINVGPRGSGGKYSFRGHFLALPNTKLEAYLAKGTVYDGGDTYKRE